MISRILLAASAAIVLYLGSVHLALTMFTQNFSPTDGQLEIAMKHTPMVISRQTTMWNAWIGFHFSHSIALILFGLMYGYLVICRWEVLRRSYFLAILGLVFLLAYVVLARVFWFKAHSSESRWPPCFTSPDWSRLLSDFENGMSGPEARSF
jgi:hypothetical protein